MTEQELYQEGKQDCAKFSHLFVDLHKDGTSIAAILEDETLEVKLCKPENKGDVVGSIEAMPESTDHEHKHLIRSLTLEIGSLINRLPQPFLNRNVPVVDFLPHVDRCLHHQRIHSVDPFEVRPIPTGSRRMHCAHAQLPPEVVLGPSQGY